MSSKMNGNKPDDLAIPAFLDAKNRKPADKASPKPTPAKPAAKKAPVKVDRGVVVKPTKPAKAPSAKAEAQARAGVKITETVKAPAAPAPAKPAPAAKPAKAAKPVGELLQAVKKHAKHFAHKNGWDLLLLQSDAELKAQLEGITSKAAAVAKMRKAAQALNAKRPKDQPAPERA